MTRKLVRREGIERIKSVSESLKNIEWVCVTSEGLEGLPHVSRSNIAVPAIYKEVHALSSQHTES